MKKNQTKFVGGGSSYLAPEVEVLEISVEQGFTLSNDGSAGWENGGGDDDYNDMGDF